MSDDNWLYQILAGEVSNDAWRQIKAAVFADTLRSQAFGITLDNLEQVVQARSRLLQSIYPAFCHWSHTNLQVQPQTLLGILWYTWLPLAMRLASQRQRLGRPLIQGILGGQGTGKTTLCSLLSLILQQMGYQTLSLSLDDLYKTYSDRLALRQKDSRLIWRGPPGTHDIELGLTVLDNIRQGQNPVAVPRFDKALYSGEGDRIAPEIVKDVEIVLFEGWFVGAQPINPAAFATAPPPIITDEDRMFACDMNNKLHDYLLLWDRLDSLVVLYPTDYRLCLAWRKQAEKQMIGRGKSGMSEQQVEEFVYYFWRSLHPELFIKPLVTSATFVDLVIEIQPNRMVGAVYHPNQL